MHRYLYILIFVLALTGIACPPASKVDPSKNGEDDKVTPITPVESAKHLKPRIEAAIQQIHERELSTDNKFWTVFHGILGIGLDKTLLVDRKSGKKVRAIDYLCDGGEIEGMKFEPTRHGLDVRMDLPAGVGQGHQDQFIAEMAQWGMTRERRFRVGNRDYTFQDFINHSRMHASVTKQQELSWAIIIIAQFYGTDHEWVNEFDEKLHFNDVVRYEVDATIDEAACGGTHRLFGLTWAYHLHLKNGGKKQGVWLDVEKKIETFKKRAKELQRPDGAFPLGYFKEPDAKPNAGGNRKDVMELRIGSTGHIVEWLALAMTQEELTSRWMLNAVDGLARAILDMRNDPIDSGALYHAAHGLHLYHERVFGTPAPYLALPPRK